MHEVSGLRRHPPPDWLLAIFLIAGLYLWQRTTFPLWEVDLLPFQLAAYQYKHGDIEGIYAPQAKLDSWTEHYRSVAVNELHGEGFGNPYFHPPFLLPLLAPLSEFPAYTWRNTLFVINIAVLFFLAHYALRACDLTTPKRATCTRNELRKWLWAIAFVLIAYPFSRAMHLGQIVPILVVMTWAGLFAMQRGAIITSGILLGVISSIKLFPAGLLLIALLTGKIRLFAIAVATMTVVYATAIAVMGTQIFLLWWDAVREFGSLVYPFFGNQSLLGWWTRIFRNQPLDDCVPYGDQGLMTIKWVIEIGVALTTLTVLWRTRGRIESNFIPASGLLISGILLALATAWEHYWLWTLPVLAWAIHSVYKEEQWGFSQWWIAGTAFLMLMKLTRFYSDDLFGRIMSGSQTMGMIGLWLWLIWRSFQVPAVKVQTSHA